MRHLLATAFSRARSWLMPTLAALLTLGALGSAHAQDSGSFTEAELDQMLAPIALYPDSLLSQVLMASTYPSEVKEAAAWSKAHPDTKGDAAIEQVKDKEWEPAVQSLVAFPQVLAMMDKQPDQVQKLGDAFLADPARLMDRVQFLRKKAQDAGNLKSNEQQKVSTTTENDKQVIIVEPAKPESVYVPVYQPSVVYGTWWYPSYPPYYWPPPPYYYPAGGFVAGVVWGAAVVGIANGLWGGCNWGGGDVNINVNKFNNVNNSKNRINNSTDNKFKHNSAGRRDVPYRDSKSREQFGNKSPAGAKDREAYRGKDGRDAQRAEASNALKDRGADPAAGRERLQGADRDAANQAARNTDRSAAGAGSRDAGRSPGASQGGGGFSSSGGSRDSAFSGARDSGASRANASRGQASRSSMPSGARAGGGGARGGGGRR
ncbi:MAG TPA: DUF3300 domain-containing protein [Rhizobacter sp.]|nr:DUF3300 domain-containing protein [Rhizobacter sp.]